MKRLSLFFFLFLFKISLVAQSENVGIGTLTPDPSAVLDVSAADKGILIPRMSAMQREMISNPAEGLMVYDSTTQTFWYFDTTWKEIVISDSSGVFRSHDGLVFSNGPDSDDFVFGQDSLPAIGVTNTGKMFLFDKEKAAFRAGFINNSTAWNPDSLGNFSVAMGINSRATNSSTVALGSNAQAKGQSAIALGINSLATGANSLALGGGAIASGQSSVAILDGEATNYNSIAMGVEATSNAVWGIALGYGTLSESYNSVALGRWNIGGGDPDNWVETDPLFELGKGEFGNRKNALTILKDGTVSFENYTFPTLDGTAHQFMQTDGSGNLSWTSLPNDNASDISTNTLNINNNAANIFNNTTAINTHITNDTDLSPINELQTLSISGQELTLSSGNTITLPDDTGVFETNNSTVRYTGADNHNFIFGHPSLPSSSTPVDANLMFFDNFKGAFRAGILINSTAWGLDSIGLLSTAFGLNTLAKGEYSSAFGYQTEASNAGSVAFGYQTKSTGLNATAIGRGSRSEGEYSLASGYFARSSGDISRAHGEYVTAQSYGNNAFGRYNDDNGNPTTWVETDPIFQVGNGSSFSNKSNAFTILKNGTVSFENYTFPNTDGTANQLLKTDGSGNLSWSSIPDDADADPTNELIANVSFSNGVINITDGGGTLNADITGVKPHVLEDNDSDSKIEFNNASDRILFSADGNVIAKMESDSMFLDGSLQIGDSGQSKLYLGNTFQQIANASTFSIQNISNGTDDLVIDNEGEIGIGLTNPQEVLDVGAANNFDGLRIRGGANNSNVQLKLDNNSNQGNEYVLRSTGAGASQGSGKFLIRDNTAGSTRVAIDAFGRVGIGRTSMDERLHVNGLVKIDGLSGTGTGQALINSDGVLVRGNHQKMAYLDFTDFVPQGASEDIFYHILDGVYLLDGNGVILGNMSEIPDGALIKTVKVYYIDGYNGGSQNMDFDIVYYDGSSGQFQYHPLGVSNATGNAKGSSTYNNVNYTLDRATYHYALQISSQDWGPGMSIYSVEITYE